MARRFTLEILMKLAQGIGANPKNFMGTRTNITFLGKGPQRNPLFQPRSRTRDRKRSAAGLKRIDHRRRRRCHGFCLSRQTERYSTSGLNPES